MAKVFRFSQGTFDFDSKGQVVIDLVNKEAKANETSTHFTLLLGANGTFKSRVLAGCVNYLIDQASDNQSIRRNVEARDCVSGVLTSRGNSGDVADPDAPALLNGDLPERVLALSNLVRDRFTFDVRRPGEEVNPDRYYHYLGVRQSSNLTTTGAMDRIVADAFLTVLTDAKKRQLLFSWIESIFPQYDLAIGFYNLSLTRFEAFLADPRKVVKNSRFGRDRVHAPGYMEERVLPHLPAMKKLLRYLQAWGEGEDDGFRTRKPGRSRVTAVSLKYLSDKKREDLVFLSQSFSVARQLDLLNGPIMLMRDVRRQNTSWIEFTNLSSGEQNLISTGARLIAHAIPGSFVVVDEPELSLNVSWQQRYIELIRGALALARGSHVVIATHSPHLVSSLEVNDSTVVVAERVDDGVEFVSHKGEFFGWGSEAVLYKVLDIPTASNFEFSREVAAVLNHIQQGRKDKRILDEFLRKCRRIESPDGDEALKAVIEEVEAYRKSLM